MTTIVTRAGKGSALTYTEMDSNFTNLNTDKLELSDQSIVNVKNYGSTLNSTTLQAAADAAYTAGVPLLLNAGVYTLTSDVTFKCSVELTTNVTLTGPTSPDGVAPSVSVYFERRMDVSKFTFKDLNIIVAPKDNSLVVVNQSRIFGNTFYNSNLTVGYESFSTIGFDVEGNTFGSDVGRVSNAITIYNAGGTRICNNRIRSYKDGVKVYSTRSCSSNAIEIYNNSIERITTGIRCAGTSMNRVSNLYIHNNSITCPDEDPNVTKTGGIYLEFCSNVKITKNTISTRQSGLRLCALNNADIEYNTILVGAGLTNPPIYLFGANRINILNNDITQLTSGGYAISMKAGSAGPAIHNNYGISDIKVRFNIFRGVDRCARIDSVKNILLTNNIFYASGTLNATARLLYIAAGTTGRYYDNEYQAVTGSTVINDASAGGMVTSAPTTTLSVITAPAATASAVTATTSDALTNSANSYVVTFTTTGVKAIKTAVLEAAPSDAPRDMAAWIAAIPGTKLMINYAPYDSPSAGGDGYIKDAIYNGVLHSKHGVETYAGTKSAVVIDEHNILSCRDFYSNYSSSLITSNIASVIQDECGYQMAAFRPPVVVDGVAYDPRISGLLGNTTITSRTGQTYVYLDSITGTNVTVVNATATATVSDGMVNTTVIVNTPGSGYQVTPSVIITSSNGVGTGAKGHAVMSGGAITSVVIDNQGSGYTAAPYIYFGITIDVYSQQISARTCIGQKADGTYVVCCVDGTTNSSGCSHKQLGDKMLALGCDNAYNLDGGGSTAMAYNGVVQNIISDPGRGIPSVLYIM